MDDGDRIRLSGEGEAGRNGGPPGDLYVEIRVKPHKLFERDGADLSTEVPISIATATLGGEVELPTLDGNVSLKVPGGTQSGKVFRLRGKGMPDPHGGRTGDLLIQTTIETPKKLTDRQEELLRELAELENKLASVLGMVGQKGGSVDLFRQALSRFAGSPPAQKRQECKTSLLRY